MSAAAKHRDAIVQSAVALFRKQGYAGTGLSDILGASGAPKGSLYYYFPNGKISIGVAAIDFAGNKVAATLEELARQSDSPSRLITQYCGLLAGWMKQSEFRDGCPITTTLLELAPEHEDIRQAGEAAFGAWAHIIEQALLRSEVEASRAHRLSRMAMATISGALVQMRVQKSATPLLDAAAELELLFETAVPNRRPG
ncbi:TetR/AcrR family transcriptional regulator [Cupriavidus metallidurans]|uniref:TetR/AcrR family transcriptional regulator n=1 Tax=Cupriavidus metallidurans TaxID=119219 RepID=UPI003D058DF8